MMWRSYLKMKSNYMVLTTCFSIAFMAYGIRYAFGMLMPEMMKELGLTNTQAGLIYTSFLTLYTITSVLVGFLVDVKGVKRTLLAFLPLLGVGTSLMSIMSSQWMGILFFGLAGIGASVCWTPLVVWVQKAYPSRRGASLGVLQLGPNTGFGVLGLLMPLIMLYNGWRGCWLILGLLSLIWLIPLSLVTPEPSPAMTSRRGFKDHVKGLTMVLRDKAFWLGGLSYMLASFAIMIPMTFTKAYANLELHMDPTIATALFSIIGFVGIIGALAIPFLSDKAGRRWSITLCNLIMALGLVGSALMARSYMDVAMWSAIIGTSYGAIWPLYAALVKDLYGWSVVGSITGLWTLLCGIGLLLSPPLGGYVADTFGSYKPTYIMGCLIALISIALIATIRPKPLDTYDATKG